MRIPIIVRIEGLGLQGLGLRCWVLGFGFKVLGLQLEVSG